MPLRRNRRQYEQLTDFDRGRIIGLREAGWSNRRIGRHLGRSDMVVARCWQQWITEGRVYRRGGSGRPRNTNDREDRAIRRVATSAPTTSLASIQRHLPPSRHPVPSRETIRRRLTEVGLRSRRPLRRLPLTPHHRQCRLDFCRPRATWSVTDWRRVIFSDESRFSLSNDDHRTRVWRRTGQRSDPAFCRAAYSNFTRYVDDILTPIVLPMLSSRPGAIYQQDNARPHTARLSQQCLQGYDVLPWPARSPDLSPIEHVWTLGRQLQPSRDTGELTAQMQRLWQDLPQGFGLAIHQNDHQARRRFVEWAQNEIAVVPDFHKRILFSDETHFWLNGYVNKQNCRIWSEANPQVYVETPLHSEKLTVWCALGAGGIIGPYFFKNDEGHNVTVNGDRYTAMITNFFIPELNNRDVQELWFQQDGATCHTARATIDLLKDTFGDRLISRFGPVNWPPRTCDLTPLDYFLWGYVKSLVYADKPQTLDHLEDNIRCVIADIRPQMLEKVIENWTSRLDYIRVSRGSHMPEIIFKM
ncbi:transposable element Tcb2 transposase [Trichonephila clavipes]|nr:transposable element Tcb2 transposase [Trichonephila clavipes]